MESRHAHAPVVHHSEGNTFASFMQKFLPILVEETRKTLGDIIFILKIIMLTLIGVLVYLGDLFTLDDFSDVKDILSLIPTPLIVFLLVTYSTSLPVLFVYILTGASFVPALKKYVLPLTLVVVLFSLFFLMLI